MELKKLRIRNFLGIGSGEITFDKPGVVLVEGVNHDSPSSISNGAGKSSIFEALFWVLYGKTKRGLAGDEVVNNVARKNCRVELEFDDYLVIRTRRDDEFGTVLLLRQRAPEGGWKELTLGTSRDTQRLVEESVKMSELSFSKVAYFGQGDIRGFAGLSDADLKRVFEQALGLTFFGEYQEKVKSHRMELDADLKEAERKRDQALREKAHTQEKIEIFRRAVEEHYERVAAERVRLENELGTIERNARDTESRAEYALGEIERELAELDSREDEAAQLAEGARRLEDAWRGLERQLAAKQAENSALADEMRFLERDIRTIDAKRGRPCEMCGRPYDVEDLDVARKNLVARLEAGTVRLGSGKAETERIGAEVIRARARFEEIRGALAECERLRLQRAARQSDRDKWVKTKAELAAALSAQRMAIEARMTELDSGRPKAKESLKIAEGELARIDARVGSLAERLDHLHRQIEVAKLLEEIMGNGGMKSYVFDAITPQLNRLIERNIRLLDDIDIEVSTVTRLKSGEYREKFSIGVRNHHGADVFEGNSGGEIQKINLAISLAINSLVRTIAEGSINAIFLDECFENLDEGSSERVLELIGEIDTPNVFVITQRQGIKEMIPNVVRVEKRGGMATVR